MYIIKQVRSAIGRTENQKRTLIALGLGRIGKTNEIPVNQATTGMIKTVQHLIEFTKANQS